MISNRAILSLLSAALGLPVAMCVLFGLARLLETMHDDAGALMLSRINLVLMALWIIDLVALVVVQAIRSLGPPPERKG